MINRKQELDDVMPLLGFAFLFLIGQGVLFFGFGLWLPFILIINVFVIIGIIFLYFPFVRYLTYKARKEDESSYTTFYD